MEGEMPVEKKEEKEIASTSENESTHTAAVQQAGVVPQNPYIVPLSILIAGALIAGAVVYSNRASNSEGAGAVLANAGDGGTKADVAPMPDDDPVLGNPDAPVTVIEFSDFQCPFCGRFHKVIEKQLIDKYVKTGKVKFVYRDFAFLGEESQWAAEAAECADEQGKFWDYHDYLFEHQNGENQGAFEKENLIKFASILGLDMTKFKECVDSGKFTQEVRKDMEDGQQSGVRGTPATFIGGKMISGAQDISVFQSAIEEAMKGK